MSPFLANPLMITQDSVARIPLENIDYTPQRHLHTHCAALRGSQVSGDRINLDVHQQITRKEQCGMWTQQDIM